MLQQQRAITKKLESLAIRHGDLIQIYEQARTQVEPHDTRDKLDAFRTEHEGHFYELCAKIRALGGEPPELPHAAIEPPRQSGTRPVLEALRDSEQRLRKFYGEACGWSLPEDLKALIEKVHAEEARHEQFFTEISRQVA